jgi:exosome complex exonuclease DIS3/RRP44
MKLWTKNVGLSLCLLIRSDIRVIATLKNDDAEDSEDEGDEAILLERKALLKEESAIKQAAAKQPTGRVVGVIKRNWRA